jgi:hypothetical protein
LSYIIDAIIVLMIIPATTLNTSSMASPSSPIEELLDELHSSSRMIIIDFVTLFSPPPLLTFVFGNNTDVWEPSLLHHFLHFPDRLHLTDGSDVTKYKISEIQGTQIAFRICNRGLFPKSPSEFATAV